MCTIINIFTKKAIFWAKILREIIIKMHSKKLKYTKSISIQKCLKGAPSMVFYNFQGTNIQIPVYSKVTHQSTPLFKIHGILRMTSSPIACRHLPNHILES